MMKVNFGAMGDMISDSCNGNYKIPIKAYGKKIAGNSLKKPEFPQNYSMNRDS